MVRDVMRVVQSSAMERTAALQPDAALPNIVTLLGATACHACHYVHASAACISTANISCVPPYCERCLLMTPRPVATPAAAAAARC
jgi:hypothetical protein